MSGERAAAERTVGGAARRQLTTLMALPPRVAADSTYFREAAQLLARLPAPERP